MNKIIQIRKFNRAITLRIGALENNFLGRPRSLGASRVLYEIGEKGVEIRKLRSRLGLDSGYLTRLLNVLRSKNLVRSEVSPTDSRAKRVILTDEGRAELVILNRLSDESAVNILSSLSETQQESLVNAMSTVERLLTAGSVVIKVVDPGSAPAQSSLGNYFDELDKRFEHGFDPGKSISAGKDEFSPPNGYFLLATLDNEAVGCCGLRFIDGYAEIKRMWVAEAVRGLGIGRRLITRLEELALGGGYTTLRLETNRALTEAQSLYRSFGFTEVPAYNSEPYAHHWFEKHILCS